MFAERIVATDVDVSTLVAVSMVRLIHVISVEVAVEEDVVGAAASIARKSQSISSPVSSSVSSTIAVLTEEVPYTVLTNVFCKLLWAMALLELFGTPWCCNAWL